ncbi:hypothetical protein D3C81_404780 [compost metagenome]
MNTMTREELDQWLQDIAQRLKPDARTALAGDIAKMVDREVEAISSRVSAADRDYFNDQVRDVIEALACIRASQPDAPHEA